MPVPMLTAISFYLSIRKKLLKKKKIDNCKVGVDIEMLSIVRGGI